MFKHPEIYTPAAGQQVHIPADMPICQSDYPLDWYQKEFVPYAEEYLALPDRRLKTVIDWMAPYVTKAQDHFGEKLLLLAHYYMGGEIVKLVETFGGHVGDSYELALKAYREPEHTLIVESAVHFMAESISVLAHPHQQVFITNPKAGCTMEMWAKDFMVEPAFRDLNERYGAENILPVCYMNTSGRVKAMAGAQGGSVCTSSNVEKICQWALDKNKKILFIPDQHMGENVAGWLNIPNERVAYWPGGTEGAQFNLFSQDKTTLERFDNAQIILFSSHCAVHTYYQPEMVDYWRERGYTVLVHPECRKTVADKADGVGSTSYLWKQVTQDKHGSKKYAVATENHLVENLKLHCASQGIEVVNVGDAQLPDMPSAGCGCATMSRNDPPHLVALLDLLRQDKVPGFNEVMPGDVVDEFTGKRQRLTADDQDFIRENARKAMENMIRIVES